MKTVLAFVAITVLSGISTAQAANGMEAQLTCQQGLCAPAGQAFGPGNANLEVRRIPINVFEDASGNDPRIQENRNQIFSPIGIVVSNKRQIPQSLSDKSTETSSTRGSGYMISPCFMRTDSHVVMGKNPVDADMKNVEIAFVAGNPSRAFKGRIVALGERSAMGKGDWAVVEFPADSCPGKQADIGYFDISNKPAAQLVGETVVTASFPSDRGVAQITAEYGCKFTGLTSTATLYTNCSNRAGSSGGPYLIPGKSGVPIAVATIQGETDTKDGLVRFKTDNSNANYAVSESEMLSDLNLRQRILDDRKSFSNPLLNRIQKKEVEALPPVSTT